MRDSRRRILPVIAVLLSLVATNTAVAQEDEKELGWFNATDFAWVLTGGNSQTSTLGLGNVLTHLWETSTFRFELGGVRSESTLKTRGATGSIDDFDLFEESITEKTAESYLANARYDWAFSGAWYAYGFAGWERNTFAGFDNRTTGAAGVGRQLVDTDNTKLKIDFGGTYVVQKDVVPVPGRDEGFAGLRFTADWLQKLSGNTDFVSTLILDQNLNDTDDVRANWLNALSIAMSDALSLRTSYQLLWDNQPALTTVPLFDAGGVPVGSSVLAPLDELDTFFTLALVLNL
ncbi:MAG: DUF481 domain-containing protein [Gemmatimonadetes bacterium]|nr:DUF481 domain-containing protein [Gemmatimonadota bacterium]NNK47795.1 DUF481 domain-containing protein [Gemmatimonadota bacterium]